MFLGLGSEDGVDETGNAICCGENGGARDGILFVGHGGRAATAGGVRFGEFADFGLHVKREIVRGFVEGSGAEGESRSNFGDAVAMGVPRRGWERERKFGGEMLGDRKAVRTESGKSADGTAELEDKGTFVQREKAIAVAEEGVEPTGDDKAERSG